MEKKNDNNWRREETNNDLLKHKEEREWGDDDK